MKPLDRIKHFRSRLKTFALAATMFAGAGTASRADLVGHWFSGAESLENAAPTGSVHDGVAVGNAGAVVYSTDLPPGFTGPALRSLSLGSGAAVEVANTATSDEGYVDTFDGDGGSSTLTVAFWAKGFPGDWSPWIAKGGEGPNAGYGWQVRRMGNSAFAGFTVRGVPDDNGWPSSGINANNPDWQHIAAVWDQSAGTRTIYVNGALSHVFTASSGTMILSPGNHLIIGGRQTDYPDLSHFYTGNLFDVRIYNHALDQQGIHDLIPPKAPEGLAAITGSGQVSLAWTPIPGVTSYTLWSKNTVTGEESLDPGITEPAFLKTGLTDGQPYLFKLLGANGGGSGPYSAEITATPAPGTAKDILTFEIGGLPAKVLADTVFLYVPVATEVTELTAIYTISPFASEDATYPSDSFVDFSSDKTFTITAENGSTKAYLVQVIKADPLTYNFDGDIQGWTPIWPLAGSGDVWANDGLGTPQGDGADDAETRFARSPAFHLNNSGPLTFQLAGGEGGIATPANPSAIPMLSINGGGFAGVSLRDVDANIYVLSKRRAGSDGGYASGSFTEAELAPYVGDGKRYSLDFIDYNKGGWGWTRLDNVSIPGTLADPETVAPQADIVAFHLAQPSSVTIDGDAITMTLPFGTPVTALAPTYLLSDGATCNVASGSAQDFSSPVTYTVTSSDTATIRDYLVSAVVMPDPAAALVGHWVSGGETLEDVSGYTTSGTHDGVAVGTTGNLAYSSDVPPGFTGKSLDLRAGNVGVMIANSATGDGAYESTFNDQIHGQVTVSFWAKGIPGAWSPWIAKGGEGDSGWQVRRMDSDPVAGFTIRGLPSEDGRGSPINVNDSPAVWHHFAGVWDESTGIRSLYVDGVLSHDVNTPGAVSSTAAAMHLALGARQTEAGGPYTNFFQGLLYDVRIYKQKLFSSEVQALAAPAAYLAWINANHPALSNKTLGGDPDGDGMSNFDEFAFGLDPDSGSSLNPIVSMPDAATGTFQYTCLDPAVSGLTCTIMVSTDLAGWVEDEEATASQSVIATDGDVQTITATLGETWQSETRIFVRVIAE